MIDIAEPELGIVQLDGVTGGLFENAIVTALINTLLPAVQKVREAA